MRRTMRTLRSETAWQSEENYDCYVRLLVAVVEQAWHDLELPTRHSGDSEHLPTYTEQEQAWHFLRDMMDSAARNAAPDEAPPCFVGLDACQSPRWQRKRQLAWKQKVLVWEQTVQALLSEVAGSA